MLRKEKQDIEKTYESKLSNIQAPPEMPQASIESSEEPEPIDEEKENCKNELLSMKEQNLAMLTEN